MSSCHLPSPLLYLVLLMLSGSAYAASIADSSVVDERLDKLLSEKLDRYKKEYPEIHFLVLQGGEQTVANMVALGKAIGRKPVNLDYEHPPELREDLINLSVNRILQMLQSKMPSSSLFRTSKKPQGQQYVCVLAINPGYIAGDSMRATRHLLDQPLEFIRKIPGDYHLSAEDYLAFVIDHEMFHCLQSMYIGPQPMSHKNLWGEYFQFLNEQAADFYALGMHIRKRGGATAFTRNIQLIRGASLASADANHFTSKAIQQVLKMPANEFTEADAKGVFTIARHFREREVIDYDTYIQYIASAIEAMNVLGLSSLITEELQISQVDVSADPVEVRELVSHTRKSLAALSGTKVK